MNRITLAALAGLAAAAAQAQPALNLARHMETVVVTATRSESAPPTLRDTVVVTREELDGLAGLTLAEVLQLRAGVEYRATGGPGQPTGLFVRGAGAAQTLVLVDGLRVGSATSGSTAVEALPLEMIERIEVVKGTLSSLYGSEAIGGVIHVITRGKPLPHLFASAGYGTNDDMRLAAGVATAEGKTRFSLSAGARKVDAASATNANVPFGIHDPDRDPHENAFVTLRAAHRLWQGELLELEAFASRSKTAFDGGSPADRNEQRVGGAKITSVSEYVRGWKSRFSVGHGRDELEFFGAFPGRFETRQDQASWVNELTAGDGTVVLGAEALRQEVQPERDAAGAALYTRNRRDTYSGFVSMNARARGHQVEASARYDDDDQFGGRTTGSASYGMLLARNLRLATTLSHGFRAPSFNDLYLAAPPFYQGNPALRPEKNRSLEVSLRGEAQGASALRWRVTAFDNRLEDLIVATAATVMNVSRARVRGVELAAEATWLTLQWRGHVTLQQPRDEDTGKQLQGRAERFGAIEASRAFGALTASAAVVASGERYDALGEAPDARLASYATVDLRLRYRFPRHWSVELAGTNLADRHYETARGYDAPRRAVLLTVRFDAF